MMFINHKFMQLRKKDQLFRLRQLERSKYKLVLVVIGIGILLWLIIGVIGVGRHNINRQHDVEIKPIQLVTEWNKVEGGLMTFEACNGFANQRLSILYGILIALTLRKQLVLPRLPLDGTQKDENTFIDSSHGMSLEFSEVYDLDILKEALGSLNIQVWERDDFSRLEFIQGNCKGQDLVQCVRNTNNKYQKTEVPINFGCGFPSSLVKSSLVFQNEAIVRRIFENLVPNAQYKKVVEQLSSNIHGKTKDDGYNVLHVRIERDWINHCKVWENLKDGIVRDNCMSNTESMGERLELMNVKKSLPLYIATQASQADPKLLQRVIQNLGLYGYTQTIMKEDIITPLEALSLPREIAALVDYFLGMKAEKFVGNSVSSFSALLLLEREIRGKWASYYNGGSIPMSGFVPIYRVPWIVYSRCEDAKQFSQGTALGLQSAIMFGNVEAYLYCIGSLNEEVGEMTKGLDVTVITRQRAKNYVHNPDVLHDVASLSGLVILPEFDKYNYVIFAGPKTFVRKHVTLDSFSTSMPKELAMYYQEDTVFTGLMLANTAFIRKGFKKDGMEFLDGLQLRKREVRRDDFVIQGLQFVNHKVNPRILTFNQLTVYDLEQYIQSGYCPKNLKYACAQVLQSACDYLKSTFILTSAAEQFPGLITFCSRKLESF